MNRWVLAAGMAIVAPAVFVTPASAARATCAAIEAVATSGAATTRPCSDPCITAARAEGKDCLTSASGVFLDTVEGCVEGDVICVGACRAGHQDCRGATNIGEDLLRCELALDAAEVDCRASFLLQPRRLAICVGRARVAGFQCRRAAFRSRRADIRACRKAFSACVDTCGPGKPAGGSGACRAEGRAALGDAVQQCVIAHRANVSACIDRDVACVQTCGETRETCNAPARAALDGVLASCTAARNAAVAACQAANPTGGAGLEACIDMALATAVTCREEAIQQSLPSFAACTETYVGCLYACPRATPPGETS